MRQYKFSALTLFVRMTSVMIAVVLALSFVSCTKSGSDFDGVRFESTHHITVQADSIDPAVSAYIHDAVLSDCNIDVEFIESDKLSIYDGVNADISIDDDINVITTYYRMGAIRNLAQYLVQYGSNLTDLTGLLGESNLYSCTSDPSEVWYLSQQEFSPDARVTFIRSDWLDKLGLNVPSSREELHECLIAFRDNADVLLGDSSSSMIPFFVDSEPNKSTKPLFDSCLDTAIDDQYFYLHGYTRTGQDGYKDGLEVLNDWYLDDLLPSEFWNIVPNTKESYLPIESGYVGAFCAGYDYLYANGSNSHIAALHSVCGEDADYIAVNCFENSNGEYTSWQEEYLDEHGTKVFIPMTCSDPLACLVYLNWISSAYRIDTISSIPGGKAYLITCSGLDYVESAEQARAVALEVKHIQRGNKCVGYGSYHLQFLNLDTDYSYVYPDSVSRFVCSTISAPTGEFDSVYDASFEQYLNSGSSMIYFMRSREWDKVIVQGDMTPW
ncbi:MAG: hypothetical protein J5476_16885 [Lachnospiraceae bacterium]|nr:hypothetical protein [Lachnospiraceae bacterium]